MKVIGITGGVGAGKSEILKYLKEHCRCRIIMADLVAHQLEKAGQVCYDKLVGLLGTEILGADGQIEKSRMAAKIFQQKELLQQVNAIVHPAVKEYIKDAIAKERAKGEIDVLFLEAALLIEDGYESIVDELWYIHTDVEVRRSRLKSSRGYSDEKIDSIIRGQLPEETFYEHCQVVLENSGTLEDVYRQIDKELGELL